MMITIQELINKIKWDEKENPKDYCLYHLDRITNKLIELRYVDIDRVDEGFIIIQRDEEETNIPLHRIREVKKKGLTIWKR